MKFWTKKRAAVLGLAAVMTISLTACGEKTPSLEEVEQAIEAGTLTVEDALDKGWVDQAWVDAYWEDRTVPAGNKIEANRVEEFITTTLSGESFTQEYLGDVLLFAFVDPASEDAGAFYDAMAAAWSGVQEAGAGMVLCLKGEDESGRFNDAPFPVIFYNDSLKAAVGSNSGMIENKAMPNTAAWYVNGSFLSAWLMALDAKELSKDAAAFAAMGQEMNTGGNAQSDSVAATSQNNQEASASGSGTSGANAPISSGGSSSHSMAPSSGASAMVPMG